MSKNLVYAVISVLRDLHSEEAANKEIILLNKLTEVLEPYELDLSLSYRSITNLVRMVHFLHDEINKLSSSSISDALHFIGHTFLGYSLAEIDYAVKSFDNIANRLQKLHSYEESIKKVQELCNYFQSSDFFVSNAEQLLESFNNILNLFPSVVQHNKNSVIHSKGKVHVIVVEDDEFWREGFVIPIVEEVKLEFKKLGYEIEWEVYDNAEDALSAVPILNKTRGINLRRVEPVRTIAIVDLYLPKNRLETNQKINSGTQTNCAIPQKQNGLKLIKDLRAPNRNVLVIVLSTSGSSDDRRDIQRLGVSKKDHIIKGFNKRKELIDALTRNITKNNKHTIEQIEDGNKTKFQIDGVDIKLDNAEIEILSATLELAIEKALFNPRDILGKLGRLINKATEDSIKKSISSIRKKIQESLAIQGVQIGKEDIIATVLNVADKKASYKLLVNLNSDYSYDEDADENLTLRKVSKTNSVKVLVVEDDLCVLALISSYLEAIKGIVVEKATNVEEAVQIAQDFRPDIVSLDLCIPRTRKEFDINPRLGNRNAGLDALEQMKLFLVHLKVILTSEYFNDRGLRDRARQLGISNEDVIPKSKQGDWINLLVQRVKQLKDELITGKKASILPEVPDPIIEVLDGCDWKNGILKLRINGNSYNPSKSSQAKNIGILLCNAGNIVSYEKIKECRGTDRVTLNDRKTWAKRIRTEIRNKWLRLQKSEYQGVEDKVLENIPEEGMILHVHVINPSKLN